MLGAKSACDPFPPYRRLHLYDTSVEFVFLVSEDFGGACACGARCEGGGVQVLAVSMGQVLVPTIALVVLAAILTGSFFNLVILGGGGGSESFEENFSVCCCQG